MLLKKILIVIALVVVLLGAGFYFKSNLITAYNFVSERIADFKTSDLTALIDEIKQDILAPPPLKFLAPQNNVVLTAAKVMEETNVQRKDNNLPALKESATLDEVALAKANDMFKNQYFEHESPSGVGPGDLAHQYGYTYLVEGENLILGNFSSEKEVVDKWMGSPGHRANILNNRYIEIGVAMVKGDYQGETVWIGVQEFGLPSSACPQPSVTMKNQIIADKSKMDTLNSEISQKKAAISNSAPGSIEYRKLVDEYNNLVASYNTLVSTTKSLITQYNNEVYTYNHCVGAE